MKALIVALLAYVSFSLAPHVAQAHGSEEESFREHTVYTGQRLGSISKRYNVSIAAICNANGIERRDPISPGQELLIPKRKDRDGSEARALRESGKWRPNRASKGGSGSGEAGTGPLPLKTKPLTHTVYAGQRLGSIAKRYNVSVGAICVANGIMPNASIRPKQKLLIPPRSDAAGRRTELWRLARAGGDAGPHRSSRRGSWSRYAKKPKKRGYLELIGHSDRWKGYVVGPKDQILGGARRAISRVLTAPSNRKSVNARLIKLLAAVSDAFGGRPLRIISGYRTTSFVKNSRHKLGRAVDFRIPGVPNEALRDFLRTFDNVGVGYYPNSTFVHLDVRKRSTYWVDYAGPGEAPKLTAP